MFEIYDGRKKFYQWDSEEKLIVDELEIGNLVHFANCSHPESLTVKIKELDGHLVCDVPNILLQSAEDICVYAYVKDDKGNRTIFDRTIAVQRKKKPTDYVYTETEVISYDALEKRIVDIEKNGAGSNITVDDALNEESENPVQNKVVAKALKEAKSVFVIEFSKTTNKMDKTYEEVVKAYNDGKVIFLNDVERKKIFYLSSISSTMIVFSNIEGVNYESIFLMPNNFCANAAWKVAQKTEVPTVNDILNALPTWQGGAY